MSGLEAASRAHNVLEKWGYRGRAISGGIRFERGFFLSAMFAVHPHHVHSRIEITIQETGPGSCQVSLTLHVYKLGQPSSRLDKEVWMGELDDVEASLMRREEPRIDRSKQNAHAGKMSGLFIGFVIMPCLLIGALAGLATHNVLVGAGVALGLLLVAAVAMPFLPFQMPDFPLENALPPAPGGSNYLRPGQDRKP